MRWRMVDRIVAFEPWRSATARKAVTLEPYALLEPLGRNNVLPETLTLEACVETGRHLVARSSEFALTAALEAVEAFAFLRPAAGGRMLDIALEVTGRTTDTLECQCTVLCSGETVASGILCLRLLPLAESFDPALARGAWEQIYAAA